MSALTDVLDYAARGWQVFPLKPQTKEPATRRGFYDATTNPATLRRWFANFPYNVGVRTGAPSNVFVLDTDGVLGFASLGEIESEHGRLPPTLLSITGNGRHYWFATRDPIPCSTAKIGPGIDVKADLGYVAAPPSIHPNGKTYRWFDDSKSPAVAPDWLLRLARARKLLPISERACALIRRPSSNGPSAYGNRALEDEIEALAAAAPGSRNQALNRAAFRLAQLAAGGELDRTHVVDRLIDASHRNGLIQDDGLRSVMATIRSGMAAGLQHPRSRSGAA
jgi:putative DNA primase/helicase